MPAVLPDGKFRNKILDSCEIALGAAQGVLSARMDTHLVAQHRAGSRSPMARFVILVLLLFLNDVGAISGSPQSENVNKLQQSRHAARRETKQKNDPKKSQPAEPAEGERGQIANASNDTVRSASSSHPC